MRVAKFGLTLFVIYSALFLTKLKFNNEVPFSGDAWQYQTMAVNFAAGQGLMKMGGIGGNYHQVYKFSQAVNPVDQPNLDFFVSLGKRGGEYNFFRTPGYIVFLGSIYKLFGVNPEVVKKIQLLMLTFIAAFLPYVGWHYWKKTGVTAGFLAGIVYLKEYARIVPRDLAISYPGDIMVEPLIAFSLLILIVVFIFWQKRPNVIRAASLGAVTGLCLLIKGTNIFLPLIIGLYLWRKKTGLVAFILGLVLTILPWSIYASRISGQIIIISTQTEVALLDNNNEYSVNGGWHPEGYSSQNPLAYYHQPEVKSLSVPAKLLAFYSTNWRIIPRIISEKIRLGFGGYIYFALALILLSWRALVTVFPKITIILSILTMWSIIYLIKHPTLFNISNPPLRIDLILFASFLIYALAALIKKRWFKLDLPTPFIVLFLNYFFLTVVILGWPRINQVIDFVFMLIFFKYFFEFVKINIHAI